MYFLEAKNPCLVTKNCWKSSYICEFILSKKRRNWFHKNLHNSSRRKLLDSSLNHIFNALLICVQYTLSCELTNFGLKCLLQIRCCQKFCKLHRKTYVSESLFDEAAGLKVCNSIKRRLQHSCFPVNITKFLKTPSFT